MTPDKLDEIAKNHGYLFAHGNASGSRIYRKLDGSCRTTTIDPRDVQHVRDRKGDAGLREWFEEKFE